MCVPGGTRAISTKSAPRELIPLILLPESTARDYLSYVHVPPKVSPPESALSCSSSEPKLLSICDLAQMRQVIERHKVSSPARLPASSRLRPPSDSTTLGLHTRTDAG